MHDEPLLKDRMLDLIGQYVSDPKKALFLRDQIVATYNEHSRDSEILNRTAREHLKSLDKMAAFKQGKLDERDEERERQKKLDLGLRYYDYLAGEVEALEWVTKFVKDHGL